MSGDNQKGLACAGACFSLSSALFRCYRAARLNSEFRMSAQILLQGRLEGAEQFLLAIPADRDNRAFEARSTWLVLVGEAIPRALLAELPFPPLMLGSSGGDRFF